MKKRVISAILSLSVLSASISVVPSVKVLGAEETNTPGIEQWLIPSGTIQTIEGVEFDDFITSFGEDAYIYYTDNKRILVVMSDGNMRHFTNGSINSSYSVVTMREGTEPPVKEINEKTIKDLFSEGFSGLKSVKLFASRGMCFVEYDNILDAMKAKEKFDKIKIGNECTLNVTYAKK